MVPPGGQPVPSFSVGAEGVLGRQLSIKAAQETRSFRADHRRVRVQTAAGDRSEPFPFGTYQAVVMHGEQAEEAHPWGALIAAPGPTFEEMKAELQARRARGEALRAQGRELGGQRRPAGKLAFAIDDTGERVGIVGDPAFLTGARRHRPAHGIDFRRALLAAAVL